MVSSWQSLAIGPIAVGVRHSTVTQLLPVWFDWTKIGSLIAFSSLVGKHMVLVGNIFYQLILKFVRLKFNTFLFAIHIN